MPLVENIAESPAAPAVATNSRLQERLRVLLFVCFCALLIFDPLALGIVDEWSVGLFEAGAAALLLLWAVEQVAASEIEAVWSPIYWPMIAFVGIVLVQLTFHQTAYQFASLSELWLYIAYGVLIFVGTQLFRRQYLIRFGSIMTAFGSAYALFALIQGFTSGGKIYWWITPQAGSVYGSYVNHNHYAGLMELLFPMALVPALMGQSGKTKRLWLTFAATLMAASIFLSGSRGGMIALLVEIAFLAGFWIRDFSAKKAMASVAVFCLVTALFLAWVAPQQVGGRISNLHDPSRMLIHRDAVRMFLAHPLLGSGFGAFAVAFPHYRVFFDGFFVNHAHDDYLELLLETGLLGFAAAVWFLVVMYREGFRNVAPEKTSASALIRTAALAGCSGFLAHSFMDFNLHIPGNAALFFVLCAAAVAGPPETSRST